MRKLWRVLGILGIWTFGAGISQAQPATPPLAELAKASWFSEGQTVWIDVAAAGRLKTRVYESAKRTAHPVLVVLVHGDIPDPRQGLYQVAQAIAHGTENVVAAGILRPGYKDAQGDASSGSMNLAIGDNYTPDAVDAVDAAIRQLKTRYGASAVVLIGHSGGAAIVANLIGRHPNDANAAILLGCACDPKEFMTRWVREHPAFAFAKDRPNPSLSPLDLVPNVSSRTRVRMVTGDKDDVVLVAPSETYVRALQARKIDAKLAVSAGVGHNDVFQSADYVAALNETLRLYGAVVR